MLVCVSVCLSLHTDISETTRLHFTMCMLPAVVALCFHGTVIIHYTSGFVDDILGLWLRDATAEDKV